jgi:hypothetical protein
MIFPFLGMNGAARFLLPLLLNQGEVPEKSCIRGVQLVLVGCIYVTLPCET